LFLRELRDEVRENVGKFEDAYKAFFKATRGLHCLAFLLRYPGREFHVSELLASLMDAPTRGRLRDAGDQQRTRGVRGNTP